MNTLKRLKSKSRKMLTRNKTLKNSKRGGEPRRKSQRLDTNLLHIETQPLGGESPRMDLSDQTIQDFINYYIKPDVPVIISVPVTPERHAFLILVSNKTGKIMVADWGERDIDEMATSKRKVYKKFVVYVKFMKMLMKKYPDYELEFFPVDDELYREADAHHNIKNFGGCSYYIYKWVKKYNDELKDLINTGSGSEESEPKSVKRSKPEEPESKMTKRSKPEESEEPAAKRTRRSRTWFW